MSKSHNQMKKEINAELKAHGLILRKHKYTLNTRAAYYFEFRDSGRVHFENMTFDSAYHSAMHLDLYAKFKGDME